MFYVVKTIYLAALFLLLPCLFLSHLTPSTLLPTPCKICRLVGSKIGFLGNFATSEALPLTDLVQEIIIKLYVCISLMPKKRKKSADFPDLAESNH
jgi:hypothetical protein